MKSKLLKNIKLCCYIALVFCFVWIVYLVINSVYLLSNNVSSQCVDWSNNTIMKTIVFACYMLGTVAMITMCTIVVFNTIKGIHENTVFPRSNEKVLFWIALADFVQLFGSWNLQVLWNDDAVLVLTETNFILPFFLLFFAFMYKVAADAVEENNLTV